MRSKGQATGEPALVRREPPVSDLVELAPDAVIAIDAQGTIVVGNAEARRLLGYGRAKLEGVALEDVITGDLGRLAPHPGRAATRVHGPIELELRTRTGDLIAAEARLRWIPQPGGSLTLCSLRDVGERRTMEVELRRSQAQLAEAQQLAKLGSWEWDIPANQVTWSDELYRIYGLEPQSIEPTYEEFLSRVHPDDREAVDERNHKAFADHQPFEDVKRVLRPDGSEFLMRTQGEVIADAEGNPIRMIGICEDVTAQKLAEAAQARLAAIVQDSSDAIHTADADGIITAWNPAAERLFGHTADQVVGYSMDILLGKGSAASLRDRCARVLRGERVDPYETRMRRRDGTEIEVSVTVSPVTDATGRIVATSTFARDITERRAFEERVRHLADHDALTGLLNRRRFEEELERRIAEARRYGTPTALVLLDVDNFKYINETFGHGAGDELLRMIGELIAGRARDTDIVARLGGDEFAIQLLGASEEDARAVGEHLLTRIRALRALSGGRTIHCTASIGIVSFDGTVPSLADAIVDADNAMYAAKEAGRDRVVVHTPMETRRLRHAAKSSPEHRIREALTNDGFRLYTQPILDLRTGVVARHEVLLRMQTDAGLVLPGDFLGAAERLGLSSAIDRWVVEHAIELLAQIETLDPDVCLEINLSGRSLGDPELPAVIANHASSARIDPARLVFEITETAAIANMQQARRFATALTQLGCSFALDDFGAGFGSFYYLKHLPLQYVKIDGEFVRAPRSRADELFIEAIVQVARGLGKETIAEFVGDPETLALMRAYGVDFAQGYHVGRPAPASEMLAGLRENAA